MRSVPPRGSGWVLFLSTWRGKEGLELAWLAQSFGHRQEMPIMIVATTRPNTRTKALARKAGAKKFATKSLDVATVSEAVRQIIEG